MTSSRPPSRSTSIFRRIANATHVEAILEENRKLRIANEWCKSETDRAHGALWAASREMTRLQELNEKLETNVEEITSAWRRTRQSVLTGLEKERQMQKSIDLRDEQAKAYQQELEELRSSTDDLKRQTEAVDLFLSKLTKDLLQAVECPICAQILYRPWSVIDCGHSFCEYCILAWEKTQPGHQINTCPYCQKKAVLVIPGTVRAAGNMLKILEPFAQEEEMMLDEVTKGDLDMEYATKYSTPKNKAEWLERKVDKVQAALRSLMSWSD